MVVNSFASGAIVTADDLNSIISGRGFLVSGGIIGQQVTADLTVHVGAGTVFVQEKSVDFSRTTKTLAAADGSNPRIDLIVLGSDAVVDIVQGTAAASPTVPNIPAGHIPLARIQVPTSDTAITNDQIIDLRPMTGRRLELITSGRGSTTSTAGITLDSVTVLSGTVSNTDAYKIFVSAYKTTSAGTATILLRFLTSGAAVSTPKNLEVMTLNSDMHGTQETLLTTVFSGNDAQDDFNLSTLHVTGGNQNAVVGNTSSTHSNNPFLNQHTLTLSGSVASAGTLHWRWAAFRLRGEE